MPTNFENTVNLGQAGEDSGFAKTLFVGSASAGYQTSAAGDKYENPAPSLESILKNGVVDTSDRGTRIVVRKGSALSITAADFFSLQTTRKRILIVGEGDGVERPSITWTVAAATWLLDTDSIFLKNLRLFLAGAHAAGSALTVAAPITVTGAGCGIINCDIKAGFDADQLATIPITVGVGGDSFVFKGNTVFGAVAAPGTTFLRLTGCNDVVIDDNDIDYATTAAGVGVVQALTTAPLRTRIKGNYMNNSMATSTAALTPMAGQTGVISDNYLEIRGAGLAHITAGSSTRRFNNYGINTGADETGALLGTPSA
jgi:hypothetical protein